MKIPPINTALGKNIVSVQDTKKNPHEKKDIDQNLSTHENNTVLLKQQIKNLSESRDKLLESGALDKKIKEEHVSLYNDFRLSFKHNWHGWLQGITDTACELINEGTSHNGLNLFFESAVYNLLTGRQLWDIKSSFPSLIKAKPSKEQWKLYSEINDYYKKRVFKIAPLHHHFEALGWPREKVVMRYWIISVIFAITGVIIALIS